MAEHVAEQKKGERSGTHYESGADFERQWSTGAAPAAAPAVSLLPVPRYHGIGIGIGKVGVQSRLLISSLILPLVLWCESRIGYDTWITYNGGFREVTASG